MTQALGNDIVRCTESVVFEAIIDGMCYNIPAIVVPSDFIAYDLVLGQAFLNSTSWQRTDKGINFFPDTSSENDRFIENLINIEIEAAPADIDINPELSLEQK